MAGLRRTIALAGALALAASIPLGPAARADSKPLVRMLDFSYSPKTLSPGNTPGLTTNPKHRAKDHPIRWRNDGNTLHDVVEVPDQAGIKVRAPHLQPGQSSSGFRLKNAAIYNYYCTYHPQMKGAIKIKPALYRAGSPGNYAVTQGPNGSTVLRLGHDAMPSNQVMDVQKKKGSGSWKKLKNGTTRRTLTLSPNNPGKYRYRARIRHTGNGNTTAWSPASKTLTVT